MKKRELLFAGILIGLFILNLSLINAQATLNLSSINAQATWGEFGKFLTDNLKFFGETPVQIITALIVSLIIMAVFYDIIALIGIIHIEWVQLVVSIGLGLIAVILKWPIKATAWIMSIGAGLGAIGIALEIGIVVVIFIGLVFGSTRVAKFAIKRKAQAEEIRVTKNVAQAKTAFGALRELDTEFRKR